MTVLPINSQPAEKAIRFVNADDQTVNRLARRNYNREHRVENERFYRRVNIATKSLPVVAIASGLLSKQGVKSSLKSGASWGLALAAPAIVFGLNKAYAERHPENKNAGLSSGTAMVASIAGFIGANNLLNRVSKNTKVNEIVDKAIKNTKETFGMVKELVKMPKTISESVNKYANLIKESAPENVAKKLKDVRNSGFAQDSVRVTKNLVKGAVKHAPELIVVGSLGAVIGKAISLSHGLSAEKAKIKNAQLDTARDVIDGLGSENAELKAQLAENVEEE